tara:strand:+ start:129 stop:608 length:480 start_codon:yes stop_codon:yes gene_type:complete
MTDKPMISAQLPDYSEDRLPCYVFDIDGTLARNDHRAHFLAGDIKNWHEFHSHCIYDSVIEEVNRVLTALSWNYTIVLLTGRNEKYRQLTELWLKNNGIEPDCLLMRKDDDFRPDYEMKSEVFDDIEDRFEVLGAFDDNKDVLRMLNFRNIFTFDCSQT